MSRKVPFHACSCYFTHQIFIQSIGLHVKYLNQAQFLTDYGELLRSRYRVSNLQPLIQEAEDEVRRRQSREEQAESRREEISRRYRPRYTDIYTLQSSFLSPAFVSLVEASKEQGASRASIAPHLKVEDGDELYSFPVFTGEFCRQFVEELRHFEESDLPKGRPNTMNNSGVLLDELGFYERFITPLRQHFLDPVCRLLYPDWVGQGLDSHKAFVVTYKLGEDEDLSYHYDNAEVTLNVCLGDKFEDGGLYLGPMRGTEGTRFSEYRHVIGRGLLHRGQQQHGAEPISDGERYNLIIWMRSSSVRNRLCPMCNESPKLVPSGGYGDGFTNTCTGWCASS